MPIKPLFYDMKNKIFLYSPKVVLICNRVETGNEKLFIELDTMDYAKTYLNESTDEELLTVAADISNNLVLQASTSMLHMRYLFIRDADYTDQLFKYIGNHETKDSLEKIIASTKYDHTCVTFIEHDAVSSENIMGIMRSSVNDSYSISYRSANGGIRIVTDVPEELVDKFIDNSFIERTVGELNCADPKEKSKKLEIIE